ncbi:MAG: energy transducer TonB [Planctomycetes bacterium]|nr:energy transducer TonB [Planctomycetota bacterium]
MARVVFGILLAVVLHALFLLFGGLLLPEAAASHASLQEVEIEPPAVEDKKPDDAPQPEDEKPKTDEPPPNAEEAIKSLDQAPADDSVPALDAASLSAITDALLGNGGGASDFGSAVSFASGGRIGGTGSGGELDATVQQAFSLGDLDQKPRAVFQQEPVYPQEMRGKKVEGVVSVLFQVGADGKVSELRVEKSSHPAFEKPAMDAVRQWKFEPGMKAGQKVTSKMRVSIRFPK